MNAFSEDAYPRRFTTQAFLTSLGGTRRLAPNTEEVKGGKVVALSGSNTASDEVCARNVPFI